MNEKDIEFEKALQERHEEAVELLDVNTKMILYQAAVKGELNDFKKLISRGYPMLEEVSPASFYWTPLHYAKH